MKNIYLWDLGLTLCSNCNHISSIICYLSVLTKIKYIIRQKHSQSAHDQWDFTVSSPKRKICWKCTLPQDIQDLDEFVPSSEQIWKKCALHHLINNGSSAVRMPSLNILWIEKLRVCKKQILLLAKIVNNNAFSSDKSPFSVDFSHQNLPTYLCIFLSWFRQYQLFGQGKSILWLEDFKKNLMLGLFVTNSLLFASQNINWWSGVDYCDVFISFLDSHSDGTHSLQRTNWWASDLVLHFSKSVLMEKN